MHYKCSIFSRFLCLYSIVSRLNIAETNYPNIYLDQSNFLQEMRFELFRAIRRLRASSDVRTCNLLQGYECLGRIFCRVFVVTLSWFLRSLVTDPRRYCVLYLKWHWSSFCAISKHYERFLLRFSTLKLPISLAAANLCCTTGLVRQRRNKAITMKRNCLPIFME